MHIWPYSSARIKSSRITRYDYNNLAVFGSKRTKAFASKYRNFTLSFSKVLIFVSFLTFAISPFEHLNAEGVHVFEHSAFFRVRHMPMLSSVILNPRIKFIPCAKVDVYIDLPRELTSKDIIARPNSAIVWKGLAVNNIVSVRPRPSTKANESEES